MENGFELFRGKYNKFIYEKFEINDDGDCWDIIYFFSIEGLADFRPSIKIDKKNIKNQNIDPALLDYLVFHVGLVELISYWKCACPPLVEIRAGYLNQEQIDRWKKLYFYGLGEFFYVNGISVYEKSFMDIRCPTSLMKWKRKDCNPRLHNHLKQSQNLHGNLVPIGGGKDSIVAIEILKGMDNDTVIINPKSVMLECSHLAGYDNPWIIKRTIDPKLIELNKKGFLNGHTPFSALVAFSTYLLSYLGNKKYIILSNESSANESNVVGSKVNHQYSKSFEFENDFNEYTKKYFGIGIKYFSLLRPLLEIQIAKLFAKYKKYHKIFKSCNVGSKSEIWKWCCKCPKCLFVFIVLSPFLEIGELVEIFGENLFEKKELLQTFLELTGNSENKPFECVGTYDEVNRSIAQAIKKYEKLPYLLQYYVDHFELNEMNLLDNFNNEHNLNQEFLEILKKKIGYKK